MSEKSVYDQLEKMRQDLLAIIAMIEAAQAKIKAFEQGEGKPLIPAKAGRKSIFR